MLKLAFSFSSLSLVISNGGSRSIQLVLIASRVGDEFFSGLINPGTTLFIRLAGLPGSNERRKILERNRIASPACNIPLLLPPREQIYRKELHLRFSFLINRLSTAPLGAAGTQLALLPGEGHERPPAEIHDTGK